MSPWRFLAAAFLASGAATRAAAGQATSTAPAALRPVVEVQEDLYTFEPANNGAGPMWCGGSTCLVRIGTKVFASGLETLQGAKPLNNCRWTLHCRQADGWRRVQVDQTGRTREPCPLACLPGGRLFLSANPTRTAPDAYAGPARPEVLQFDPADPRRPGRVLLPTWDGTPPFTEHSYRSFAADGRRGELILFQNIGYTHATWAFRDGKGKWSARGKLVWPWGAEYDKPQPIRVCYPNVALTDRAVHFCGVSDIVEPYRKWRDHKRKLTGRTWDYDFRRLFYTWCDDVTTGRFGPWVEVASRDKTCGWISPRDLWVDPNGAVHLLWSERAIDTRLRKAFFPDARQVHALNYAVVRRGKVVRRHALVLGGEGLSGKRPGAARFHVTPDHRLRVLCYLGGTDGAGRSVSENRLLDLTADGRVARDRKLGLRPPFTSFFTATIRAGCLPSNTIDLLGQCAGAGRTIRYARIALRP